MEDTLEMPKVYCKDCGHKHCPTLVTRCNECGGETEFRVTGEED
jgi:uncharacterized OB-fold protein